MAKSIRSSTAPAEVFVDTAGFLALWDAGDAHHRRALEVQDGLVSGRRSFITTDYVLDETAALLRVRHSHAAAADFLDTMERSRLVTTEWTSSLRFWSAAAFFRKHRDKSWSFTDCLSFVTMGQRGIREAFTTDRHFTQAGFLPLLGR